MSSQPAACLSSEMLAAWIDRRLDSEQSAAVVAHLSRCARCRLTVETLAEFEQERTSTQPARFRAVHASRWIAVAAGLTAIFFGYPYARNLVRSQNALDAIPRLVAGAPTTARTIEPRLTGGFVYAPYHGRTRADREKTPEEALAAGAALPVLDALSGVNTPAALHAAGLAALLAGRPEDAVQRLTRAANLEPDDAAMWSDLAAAHLVAGGGSRASCERALAAADRALAIDPALVEARFNRAIALQRLGQRAAAIQAWAEYIVHEREAQWRAEGRTRLSALRSSASSMPASP